MLSAPAACDASTVVPDPANGSRTRIAPRSRSWRITPSAQTAEKPALYRNHRCTGRLMLLEKVDDVASPTSVGVVSINESCLDDRCKCAPRLKIRAASTVPRAG